MPPALEKVLAYCSVRKERQMLTPTPPPNGPSPSIPVNMCWNIWLRNTASKSRAAFLARALPEPAAPRSTAVGSLLRATVWATSAAAGGVMSHHLDVGLDRARGLDRLQDG